MTRSSCEVRSKDILANRSGMGNITKRRYYLKKKFKFKVMNGRPPEYIKDLLRPKEQITSLVLRDDGNKLAVPFPKRGCLKHPLGTVEHSSGTICQDLNEMRLFFKLVILKLADVLLILQ